VSRQSLVFAVSGTFFGLLVGWIIGSHHDRAPAPRTPPAASASTPTGDGGSRTPPTVDEGRVQTLEEAARRNVKDASTRAELGNLYFDAERFDQAIRWYEESLQIDPRNVNVSTDLGVSYYYINQPDRALQQFEKSLAIDPRHAKTILNLGIVRAFGKQDLKGAAEAWQRVIEIAPDSPEGRAARQALESLKAAHPGGTN
jgi:tetratricopeptide (TPR) repeat protein